VGQLPVVWVNGGGELAANMGACCALWQEYKAVFYECSAMTGYNIMEPMLHMARSVNRGSQSTWDASPAVGGRCGLCWAMEKRRALLETDFLPCHKKDLEQCALPPCPYLLCLQSTKWRLDIIACKDLSGRAGC